ncbi:MAG: hypothetical protein ACXVGC_15565, partial [Mycobacteriaceae bacterium]
MSDEADASVAQEAAPARVIAVLRVLVVLSMAVLVAFGTPVNRTYFPLALTIVGIGWVYGGLVLVTVLRGRWVLPEAGVTALDGALTVSLIAVTGGAHSLVVAILPLAIVAAAARQGLRRALVAALVAGMAFAVVVLTVPQPDIAFPHRLEAALWWS